MTQSVINVEEQILNPLRNGGYLGLMEITNYGDICKGGETLTFSPTSQMEMKR